MESVRRILSEGHWVDDAVYIVFDGTSHYAVYGCDIDDEVMENDVEVVKGPFLRWDDRVDAMVEELNNEAYGNGW